MINSRIRSFKFALKGIRELFSSQPNARIHLFFALLVVAAGIVFSISRIDWCLLIFAIFLVLAAEAVNTALENLTDLVSPDYHPLAGKAKDLAAAAVLLLAIASVLIGLFVFGPHLLQLIK